MIKLDTKNWEVETDCNTVGEFMAEASLFGLSVRVTINDGDEYLFEGCHKVNVEDNTPLDKVLFDRTDYTLNARASFRVFTKPKQNTVRKSGWVNIYSGGSDRYCGYIWDSTDDAECECQASRTDYISTAKIEWEEVEK